MIPGLGNRASAMFGAHGPRSIVLGPMANAYRRVIGKHFPARTLVQVVALVEDRVKVEIEATAVVPPA